MTDALATIPPEEHDRQKFIGGSDIAAILGISPWKSPVDLWRDKTTPRSDKPAKAVFKRGIRWEGVVAEMLVEDLTRRGHSVEVIAANRRYRDSEHPMFAAEVDYELRIDGAEDITNVELKTVHPFKVREWGDSGTENLPLHYRAQVAWGLGVTQRKSGILAALFGADELRTYDVPAEEETIAGLRRQALAFWEFCVVQGNPPPPRSLTDLAVLFPKEVEGPPLMADDDLTTRVLRLRACKLEIDAREAEAEAIEFEIKQAMKDCVELVLPNGKTAAEWKTRSGSFLAQDELKEAHPAIAKEFARKWHSRVFRLKTFDPKGL